MTYGGVGPPLYGSPTPAYEPPRPLGAATGSAPVAAPGATPSANPEDPVAQRAVAFAHAQRGKPYCYGGTGPSCYDCSGLTYAAWRWAGRPLPRSSAEQRAELTAVPWALARPGDVVWRPGHVGVYVGQGWVIHAPETGKRVEYEPAQRYEVALRP